jgi:hypothetical protein
MITAKIPYEFLAGFCHLTWRDIEFGLSHNYVSPTVAIDYASARLCDNNDPDTEEIAIAGSSKDDPLLERVSILASRESATASVDVRAKWLCILLAWLYENRAAFEDPLSLVEDIYEDFDYPEEIAHLIRYMPIAEPDLGSKEANLARLVTRWGEYVARGRTALQR